MNIFDLVEEDKPKDDYPTPKGNFIIKGIAHSTGDGYEVLEYTIDEEFYDDNVSDQVIFDLEYDMFPDLGILTGEQTTFKFKVESLYTKDYYGEVDLDIRVEVL